MRFAPLRSCIFPVFNRRTSRNRRNTTPQVWRKSVGLPSLSTAPDLDKLRRAIINTFASRPDLDAGALRVHLSQDGFDRAVDGLLSPQIYIHAGFARPEVDIETARGGWLHLRDLLHQIRQLAAEIARAEQGLAEDMTEARLAHLDALRKQWEDELGDAPRQIGAGQVGRGAGQRAG